MFFSTDLNYHLARYEALYKTEDATAFCKAYTENSSFPLNVVLAGLRRSLPVLVLLRVLKHQ